MADYNIALEYTEWDQIIDYILYYIEIYLLPWNPKVGSRKVYQKVTLYFIRIRMYMRSDIDLYVFSRSMKSLDSIVDYMLFCSSPATMKSRTFTTPHEYDHWAISTERCYRDIRYCRIYTIILRKWDIFVFRSDLMYICFMYLTHRTYDLWRDQSVSKITIIFMRDIYFKSWKWWKYFHITEYILCIFRYEHFIVSGFSLSRLHHTHRLLGLQALGG